MEFQRYVDSISDQIEQTRIETSRLMQVDDLNLVLNDLDTQNTNLNNLNLTLTNFVQGLNDLIIMPHESYKTVQALIAADPNILTQLINDYSITQAQPSQPSEIQGTPIPTPQQSNIQGTPIPPQELSQSDIQTPTEQQQPQSGEIEYTPIQLEEESESVGVDESDAMYEKIKTSLDKDQYLLRMVINNYCPVNTPPRLTYETVQQIISITPDILFQITKDYIIPYLESNLEYFRDLQIKLFPDETIYTHNLKQLLDHIPGLIERIAQDYNLLPFTEIIPFIHKTPVLLRQIEEEFFMKNQGDRIRTLLKTSKKLLAEIAAENNLVPKSEIANFMKNNPESQLESLANMPPQALVESLIKNNPNIVPPMYNHPAIQQLVRRNNPSRSIQPNPTTPSTPMDADEALLELDGLKRDNRILMGYMKQHQDLMSTIENAELEYQNSTYMVPNQTYQMLAQSTPTPTPDTFLALLLNQSFTAYTQLPQINDLRLVLLCINYMLVNFTQESVKNFILGQSEYLHQIPQTSNVHLSRMKAELQATSSIYSAKYSAKTLFNSHWANARNIYPICLANGSTNWNAVQKVSILIYRPETMKKIYDYKSLEDRVNKDV